MEDEAIKGLGLLLNYGVLGIFSVLLLAIVYYMKKENKEAIALILDSKEREVEYWKKSAEKHDSQMDNALTHISQNSAKTLELFERQQIAIDAIPDRTIEKIRLMDK